MRVATTISFQMKCIDRVGKACDSPRSPFTSFTFSLCIIFLFFEKKNGNMIDCQLLLVLLQ